ncbi:MAG: helicase [Undibacterium sp.]|nr:helicase [Opitutaceae bacterium]
MEYSLDARTARLSVGEFSDFTLGPRDSSGGQQGIWRAQLGTYWHQQLRAQATAEHAAAAEFEITIEGRVFHRGWTLTLNGRIDQLLRLPSPFSHVLRDNAPVALPAKILVLREIKTVTCPLPADETELRRDYPSYFTQLATYVALARLGALGLPNSPPPTLSSQLIFVEAGSGLAQTLALTPADENLFRVKLERIVEFLDLRLRARERLRHLSYRPAFATPRPGQETTAAELTTAFDRHPAILFEAPTGFGKTGVLLEFALGQLRSGHFDRALYLTSKSTGQLQVVRTLTAMTSGAPVSQLSTLSSRPTATSVTAWHVRNKSEHCVNHVYHCHRDSCAYLADLETRWASSGLSRFYLLDDQARDLPTLRAAGQAARICPYEITRAALAFNDVWIGDYNYVFAPTNRTLFYNQPGFDPARTLLLIDEAHNLPARVADAHSHHANAADARALLTELDHLHAPKNLLRAWESWTLLLSALPAADSLDPALEADVADTLSLIATALAHEPIDSAALGQPLAEILWSTPQLSAWLANPLLKKLLWSPRPAELSFTCIDAADAIGETLRAYGGIVLASATLSPTPEFATAVGFPPSILQPSVSISQLSALGSQPTALSLVTAHTPWRADAYDLAYDLRVDTSFRERTRHHATTAATIAALHAAAYSSSQLSTLNPQLGKNPPTPCVAVFFPSYAYAETIAREIDRDHPGVRVALQPRLTDLAAQTAWVEESLALTDALFLVLGSSFAESIDLLGGRVTHAMVVGPALPEVNAVQRARVAEFSNLGREAAFRRVYQIPGMAKVNQALGRLVRAPGQRARVLLHCRRFAEITYAQLLASDYQFGQNLLDDLDLAAWLARSP